MHHIQNHHSTAADLPKSLTRLSTGRQIEPPRRLTPHLREKMLELIPPLRAFAISLSGSVHAADDLVQETLLRAISHIDSFEPGTNLRAWLFTILHNAFLSECRKRRFEVRDLDEDRAAGLKSGPEQYGFLEFQDLRTALAELSADQREAVIMVGAMGLSYGEAAAIAHCAVGTIKSRVNRGRVRLAHLLSLAREDLFDADGVMRAVVDA
jgi:RNA polymerase sigma-70 factor, ECF subfamily